MKKNVQITIKKIFSCNPAFCVFPAIILIILMGIFFPENVEWNGFKKYSKCNIYFWVFNIIGVSILISTFILSKFSKKYREKIWALFPLLMLLLFAYNLSCVYPSFYPEFPNGKRCEFFSIPTLFARSYGYYNPLCIKRIFFFINRFSKDKILVIEEGIKFEEKTDNPEEEYYKLLVLANNVKRSNGFIELRKKVNGHLINNPPQKFILNDILKKQLKADKLLFYYDKRHKESKEIFVFRNFDNIIFLPDKMFGEFK